VSSRISDMTNLQPPALEDIKVLDFGWALVGSLTGKHMADNGAKVIRVESSTRIDLSRTNRMVKISSGNNPDDKPWYTHLNTSKLGLALNLKKPQAKGIVEKLIQWADVINENFTPGTLSKLGIDYNFAKAIKPDIIMLSSSAYGQTGPMAYEWGVDGTGLAMSGYLHQTGWPDRMPVGANAPFGDVVLPYINAMAIIAALDYRRRTGKGQHIDTSMVEVCIHANTPNLLDHQGNNHFRTRSGNRIEYASPHGAFPCQGDDRWCTIAVFSDIEWQAFCRVIGNPDWTKEAKFADLKSRKENEDELESLVSQWTYQHSDYEVMNKMQEAGVSAGVVQTMADIVDSDLQLREREFLLPIDNPHLGVFGHPSPAYKLMKNKPRVSRAPSMGEHTEQICIEILGLSDEEFAALVAENVFV
jgi:benzylsuccinate CoA-transferase BbsF subunit